ncbi:uncharacterized protein LOC119696399 isoform X3 [Motacilla alba alba]|uniref:uncharacterized protein LOC119696399 isoform X3 n=1 Tax=Motacilla alba alba TaxID=1094192 RepID=UPI0018D53660|nr:uncharacterized protein LOC119696399 isoform X3 [Motacilla alba alba]
MEPKLSLEQRTERLVQRSQALLRPRPRGPERAKPLLGSAPCSSTLEDPLVQWRLRRCRGEEPALDTPLVGRARLGSAAPRGSLQGAPPGKSRDSRGALQGAVPWQSRDPPEAQRPIGRRFCPHQGLSSPLPVSPEPLWQEPCWRPHDCHRTLWPTRSSSLDTLQGAGYSQSGDSHHAPRQISSSCCAPLRHGAPPHGERESHEPLPQEPFWGSHDCLGALWCAPYWKSCDSQDALWPAREALPEPLRRGGPGLRSGDAREAPQPIRSSARDALQRAPWQQPLGPSRPSWNAHLSTPAHGGANKAMRPQNCTGEPAGPRGGSRDCGSHHAPRPRQSRRSRECPLRSVPAAPQVLSGCRPGP